MSKQKTIYCYVCIEQDRKEIPLSECKHHTSKCTKFPPYNISENDKLLLEEQLFNKCKEKVCKKCDKEPTFGIKGSEEAQYCSDHKEENMINIINKPCLLSVKYLAVLECIKNNKEHVMCMKVHKSVYESTNDYYKTDSLEFNRLNMLICALLLPLKKEEREEILIKCGFGEKNKLDYTDKLKKLKNELKIKGSVTTKSQLYDHCNKHWYKDENKMNLVKQYKGNDLYEINFMFTAKNMPPLQCYNKIKMEK